MSAPLSARSRREGVPLRQVLVCDQRLALERRPGKARRDPGPGRGALQPGIAGRGVPRADRAVAGVANADRLHGCRCNGRGLESDRLRKLIAGDAGRQLVDYHLHSDGLGLSRIARQEPR